MKLASQRGKPVCRSLAHRALTMITRRVSSGGKLPLPINLISWSYLLHFSAACHSSSYPARYFVIPRSIPHDFVSLFLINSPDSHLGPPLHSQTFPFLPSVVLFIVRPGTRLLPGGRSLISKWIEETSTNTPPSLSYFRRKLRPLR